MAIRASATGDYSPKLYWDQAGIRGELEVRSGCLVIFSSELGTAVVPVFTADFHWNQDQRTINFGKSTWRVGDEIEVGGGFERPRTVRMDSLLGDELTHRVDRCIELTGAEHWSFATPITGRG